MGKPEKTKKSRERATKSTPEPKSSKKAAKKTPERKSRKKAAKKTPEKARPTKTVKKGKTLAVDVGAERDGGSSKAAADDVDGGVHAGAPASFWLPMSRVWRLVRGEGVNANITGRTTVDVVFLINKASEMFLAKLVEDANFTAKKAGRKAIRYEDLALNVNNKKRYEFLSDFVPGKISAEDALKAQTLN